MIEQQIKCRWCLQGFGKPAIGCSFKGTENEVHCGAGAEGTNLADGGYNTFYTTHSYAGNYNSLIKLISYDIIYDEIDRSMRAPIKRPCI